jgi:hypothetical protein
MILDPDRVLNLRFVFLYREDYSGGCVELEGNYG